MRTEEKTIDGVRYRMTQVGTSTGVEVILRLSRPFAALMSESFRKGKAKPTASELAEGITRALRELTSRDVKFIARKLAAVTTVYVKDGATAPKPFPLTDVYEEHFRARYGALLEWLRWGLEFNRFFASVLALVPTREDGPASSSSSLPGSIGSSGGSSAVQDA